MTVHSRHWMLEPHVKLMERIDALTPVEPTPGLLLTPVTSDVLSRFIAFENSQSVREVGPALHEHLFRFGFGLALAAMESGRVVGTIRARLFHEYDPILRSVLLAYVCVDRSHRGRGVGSLLVGHLAASLLKSPHVDAIGAEVDHGNVPSLRLFRKLGFEIEGVKTAKVIFMRKKTQPMNT